MWIWIKIKLKIGEDNEKSEEKVLDIPDQIMDQIRLVSTYKGVQMPVMFCLSKVPK